MTQHEKIIDMCLDGNYHCQNEFRGLFIYSPHKRRSEIEERGKYEFKSIKCEHGVRGQYDYIMREKKQNIPIQPNFRPDFLRGKKLEKSKLI